MSPRIGFKKSLDGSYFVFDKIADPDCKHPFGSVESHTVGAFGPARWRYRMLNQAQVSAKDFGTRKLAANALLFAFEGLRGVAG